MRQLLARLTANNTLALELAAASFFINILALAAPFFFILVFNRYLTGGVDGTLITLTAGMLLAVVLQFVFRAIRTRMAGEVGIQADEPVVRSVFDALSMAKVQALGRIRKSRIVQAAQSLQMLQAAYSAPNVNSVLDMPYSFLFILVIFLLNFQLGVVACIGAAFTLGSAWFSVAGTKKTTGMVQNISAGNQILINSAINDPETLRLFGGKAQLASRWGEQMKSIFSLRRFNAHSEDISQARLMAIGLITRTFIIALGARQVVMGELSIGALIGVSVLASLPLTILARFVRTLALLNRAGEAQEVLDNLLKLPRERLSGTALKSYSGRVVFKDLAFAYPGSKSPLFESVNLELSPGQTLGITGHNGSGKTTLARIIAGLLEPSRGQVLVDGIELSQVSLDWWRKQIIYLPQEPGFLPATIRENIMAASQSMDNEGLNKFLMMTGMRRFLDSHPDGLDLELDETGKPLPLGIRRRLALSRALTMEGPLAVLDEPGEGLDAEGWKMAGKIIRHLKEQKKTIIILSGDPRFLMDAETIIDLGRKPVPAIMVRGGPGDPAQGAQ